MIDLTKPALGLARWIWGLIVIGLIIAASWWVIATLTGGQKAMVEARIGTNQADAALQSGQDAARTIGEQANTEAERERSVTAMQKDVDDAQTVSDAHAAGAGWLCLDFGICADE